MTLLRATVVVSAFGLLSLFGASRAHTQHVSLPAELLKDWSELKIAMHKVANEMPADKYGFRPTEAQQTFGERTVHIATVNVALLGALDGTATPKPTIDPKATTKDAAIKAMNDSFDYGAALLKQQTDQTLLQPVVSPPRFLGPSSRARIITFLVGHTWDMYGQLVVYLRLNGHVPIGPASAQDGPHIIRPGDVRSMTQPSASKAELALVQRARRLLDRTDRWNRTDSGGCPSRQTRFSIDCALEASARPGESDALAAAQQEARLVIWDLVVSKEYDHPLTDYNNDSMIAFADVQRLLRWLETRVRIRMARHDARGVREDAPQANPPATKADLAIAREARRLLATPAAWNDHDTRDCPADAHTFSFFCGLVEASDRVTANLEMRGATMQEARFVVDSLADGRKFPHRLMDFNNDPGTGFSGVQEALGLLESRLEERVRNGK